MSVGLVLGAGGLVGVAHHVGVLCALEEELGLTNDQIEVVIGTSAGAAMAAYLRTGHSPGDLLGRAGELVKAAPSSLVNGPLDVVRRGIGSAYIVARSSVRFPSALSLVPLPSLRRAFPAGIASMGDGASRLEEELPRSWPARPLWLAAYDLVRRRRVVLGLQGTHGVDLPRAVQASCAIPGVYAPVRAGDCVLVDGGAWSLTNVDLVSMANVSRVVCVAPMSYDSRRPPDASGRLLREIPTRLLRRDVNRLRRRGTDVVVLAPGPREVALHGTNLMRASGLSDVAALAFEESVRFLRRSETIERWRDDLVA